MCDHKIINTQSKPPQNVHHPDATPSSKPTASWHLHPSFPLDIRLFGAGLLGLGALYYSSVPRDDSAPPPVPDEESPFPTTIDQKDNDDDVDSTAPPPSSSQLDQEEPATVVDSHAVLGVIENVLSKSAEQLLREDEHIASISSKEEEPQHKASLSAADNHVQAAQGAITTGISDTAGESVAADTTKAQKGVDAMTPRVASLSSLVGVVGGGSTRGDSDSSTGDDGVSMSPSRDTTSSKYSAHGTVGPGVDSATSVVDDAQTPAISASLPPSSIASAGETASSTHPSTASTRAHTGPLGKGAAITASTLLDDAVKRKAVQADKWEDFPARQRQAEADADFVRRALADAAAQAEQRIHAAESAVQRMKNEAERAQRALTIQAQRCHAALQDALNAAEEGHAQRVRDRSEELTVAHAEMTLRERAERQRAVDALRLEVSALGKALEDRGREVRQGATAARLSNAAFALRTALAQGSPLEGPAKSISTAGKGDQLMETAARVLLLLLSQGNATKNKGSTATALPTVQQLQEGLVDVERTTKELWYLPATGHGGLLSVAMAKVAAWLKVPETQPYASSAMAYANRYGHRRNGGGGGGGGDAAVPTYSSTPIHTTSPPSTDNDRHGNNETNQAEKTALYTTTKSQQQQQQQESLHLNEIDNATRRRSPVSSTASGDSSPLDVALAKVRSALAAGELLDAADGLESAVRGTAASHAVKDWVEQARKRARAELVAELVETHAKSRTACMA